MLAESTSMSGAGGKLITSDPTNFSLLGTVLHSPKTSLDLGAKLIYNSTILL